MMNSYDEDEIVFCWVPRTYEDDERPSPDELRKREKELGIKRKTVYAREPSGIKRSPENIAKLEKSFKLLGGMLLNDNT